MVYWCLLAEIMRGYGICCGYGNVLEGVRVRVLSTAQVPSPVKGRNCYDGRTLDEDLFNIDVSDGPYPILLAYAM